MSTDAEAPLESCSEASYIDWSSHDRTVEKLRRLYRTSEFAHLDKELSCLVYSKRRFNSGKMGASAAYWMYRKEMSAPGVDPGQLSKIREWDKTVPDSIFAVFAESRFRYGMAWNARGSSYAEKVGEEAWEAYHRGLRSAEVLLLEAPAPLKNTAIWQNLLLAIALDSDRVFSDPAEVFVQGVEKWPFYYDFYEVLLSRLVPRWGGSWEAVDQFVSQWTAQLEKLEGRALYARLYNSVLSPNTPPSSTRINWILMRESLDDLIAKYPTEEHKDLAVNFACTYQDSVFLRKYYTERRGLRPVKWLRGKLFQDCFSWIAKNKKD